jgi:hypothetical protein
VHREEGTYHQSEKEADYKREEGQSMSLKVRKPVCVLVLKAFSYKAREDNCSP